MRILTIATAICFSVVGLSAAAEVDATVKKTTNIPAQALEPALQLFAKERDLQVIYRSEVVGDLRTAGATGELNINEALMRLLSGTKLTYQYLDDKTVTIVPIASGPTAATLSSSGLQPTAPAVGDARVEEGRRSWFKWIRLAQDDTAKSGPPETNDSSSKDDKAASALEEIVVTAQKREERISDVPISISAYTPESIDRRGIRDISDIAAITPGVNFSTRVFVNNITIRGVSNQNAGSNTTALYVDDIPIQTRTAQPTFASGTPKIFDLERVEVLRGPQGTLFGASAQGGAVRFITPQPSLTDYSVYARTEVSDTRGGEIGHEAGLAVGGPIIRDKLGFRVSGWHQREGGYVDHDSALPGGVNEKNANRADSYVGRAALAFAPMDNLRFTASIFGQDVKTHDLSIYDPGLSDPGDSGFVGNELLLQPVREKIYVPSLKVEADFDDVGFLGDVTVTSITTHLHRDFTLNLDYTNVMPAAFGMPLPTSADQALPDSHQTEQNNFVQELRLSSADPAARLQWIVGGYYSVAKQNGLQTLEAPAFPQQILDHFGVPIETLFGAGLTDDNLLAVIDQRNRDEQRAVFANLEYDLFGGFSVIAGVRASREENSFRARREGALFGGVLTFDGNQKESPITPKFGVNYRPNDNHLFYASAAKGYRPGGPNAPLAISTDACAADLAELGLSLGTDLGFDSDSLWSYELGSKNVLLGGRLHVSASVYHIDWKDIQRLFGLPGCLSVVVANAGKAESQGFDIALDAKLTDRLTFGLTTGYTSAEFTATTTVGGQTPVQKGEQVSDISPWNVTAALEYQLEMSPTVAGYVRVENRYNSKNNGRHPGERLDPAFFHIAEATNVLNIRIGAIWDRYEVTAFANNVLNAHPVLGRSLNRGNPPFGDLTIRPLTIGLTGFYRW